MEGIPGLGSGLLDIVVRTLLIYVFVVALLRIGGKREVGQLGTLDLVALLLLSNAVQNAMVGTDSSIAGGVVAATVIIVATRMFDLVIRKSVVARRLLVGESRVLIQNGRVNRRALEHEQLSEDDLQEALEEHGLQYRRQVKKAVLQPTGLITVIPQPEAVGRFRNGRSTPEKHVAGRVQANPEHQEMPT